MSNYKIENGVLTWVEPSLDMLDLSGTQVASIAPGVLPASLRGLFLSGTQVSEINRSAIRQEIPGIYVS